MTRSSIHCPLMALERWPYEQIDRGEKIELRVNRILRESESLAFAGPLFDVGKRLPILFASSSKLPHRQFAPRRMGPSGLDDARADRLRALGLSGTNSLPPWLRSASASNQPHSLSLILKSDLLHWMNGRLCCQPAGVSFC
jgi:hypothetical protein